MFLHFNMRRMKCLKQMDSGPHSEFYCLYRVYVDQDVDNPKGIVELAQGFSAGCPIDDGYSMKAGDQIELNDPRFTIRLPEVKEGQTRLVNIELIMMESDQDTVRIKKAFTNAAAEKLIKLHEAHAESKTKLREEFFGWLTSNDNSVRQAVELAANVAAGAITPYIAVAKAAIDVLGWSLRWIEANGDELIGICRAQVIITREKKQLKYRWVFNEGVETWFNEEWPAIRDSWRAREANGANEVDCTYVLHVVGENARELKSTIRSLADPS